MTRLYFWFRGAACNRTGGPWWYKDFEDRDELDHHPRTLRPFLEAYSVSERIVELHPMDIKPQRGDTIVRVPGP